MNYQHRHNVILNINPQNQMTRPLRFKQRKNGKQILTQRLGTCHQFSFIYLGIHANYLEPYQLILHLKQLKSLKYLTLDLTYFLQINKYNIDKIFNSFKYLKSLSVLHFGLKRVSYLPHQSHFQILCKAIPMLNDLFRVQVRLSLHAPKMVIDERWRLSAPFESFCQLERFTFTGSTFLFDRI